MDKLQGVAFSKKVQNGQFQGTAPNKPLVWLIS